MVRFMVPILALVFLALTTACFTEWTTYSRDQLLVDRDWCVENHPKVGYAIDIPADWDYLVKDCREVVFDSRDGATITVYIKPTDLDSDPKVAFDQMVEALKQEVYGTSRDIFVPDTKLHVYSTKVIQQHGHDAVYRILNNKKGASGLLVRYCGQTWHQVYMLHPDWSADSKTKWAYVASSDRCIDDKSHANRIERSLRSLRLIEEG